MELKNGYIIHKTETRTLICKILNEYDNEKDANNDLVNLLTNKKTEKDLLKEFAKKESW